MYRDHINVLMHILVKKYQDMVLFSRIKKESWNKTSRIVNKILKTT